MVSEWGGEMYFVYMPDYNRQSTGKEDSNREFALYTATKLKIPIIDIHKEVFAHHPDPLSLFPFRTRGHYTAEGYRLVAEAIANKLVVDDVLPTNSIKATQTLEELVNNLSTDDGRSNIDEMDEIEETLIQSLHETTIY